MAYENDKDGSQSQEVNINKEIDEIYKEIGEIGPYQILILVMISCSAFVLSNADYSYNIFLGATPDHRFLNESKIFLNIFIKILLWLDSNSFRSHN